MDSPQNKTQKKKKHETQNPSSLKLFTFVVLSPIDVGVVDVTILLLCSKKWLFLYVSPCRENLKSRFTINPFNGIVIGLLTRPFILNGTRTLLSYFLNATNHNFFSLFLFTPLCPSLFLSSFCVVLISGCKEVMIIMVAKLLPPLPLPPKV